MGFAHNTDFNEKNGWRIGLSDNYLKGSRISFATAYLSNGKRLRNAEVVLKHMSQKSLSKANAPFGRIIRENMRNLKPTRKVSSSQEPARLIRLIY